MINKRDAEDSAKVTVYIDPDLAEIIPGFLENRRRDVQILQTALRQNDMETIRVVGHRMKGDGGGYGFNKTRAIGEKLEDAAARQCPAGLQRESLELADFVS